MPIKTADNWCDVCGWRHTTVNCGRDDCPRADEEPARSLRQCCEEMAAQRDELLAVLKELTVYTQADEIDDPGAHEALVKARTLIAICEGK